MGEAGLYFDWNATTPPHPDVLDAMVEVARSAWGNPSSVHASGRRARAVVEDAREALARALEVDARDVIFTSGGTESNNLALSHAKGLITSRLEHPSVLRLAEWLEREGRPVAWLPVRPDGQVDLAPLPELARALPAGSWLALQAANHETGVLQPIAAASALARGQGLFVHVDAVQAFGKVELPALTGVHSVSVSAHKIRGPKGIGALALRGVPPPRPLLLGGGQERGLRPGTLDPVLTAGFGVAVERAASGPERYRELAPLRDALERGIGGAAVVNGAGAPRLPHVSNLSFPGIRGDELVAALDLLGARISSGSACSAGTTEPSPGIEAMAGRERARTAVRISLGDGTLSSEIDRLLSLLARALGRPLAPTSSTA
ncbi:MAG TPA: cysteine desulfurase family protein [Polyangiaceae bacterium]|nr:cysteine desulfurase family protein [Polyangiaceae bacterium]